VNRRRSQVLIAAFVGASLLSVAGRARAESACGQETLRKKDPIPFRPIEMKNPATGEAYLGNEEIQVGDKTMRALDFFREVNDTEQKLNAWGYTLRGSGSDSLGELQTCVDQLEKQVDIIKKDVKDDRSLFDLEQYKKDAQEAYERFKSELPSWDTLYEKADDESVKVYLPPEPSFSAPTPSLKRPEMKDVFKERTWDFDLGEKSKFWVGADASLSLKAQKIDAALDAKGHINASLLGVWEGELGSANAHASSAVSGPGSASVDVKVLGQTLYSKGWTETGLKLEDEQKLAMDYSFSWRFAIGPIPCAAKVGAKGGIGVKYGLQLLPLAVSGYVVPYGYALGYAQVGIDIGIAAGGVGGELTLIADYVTLNGQARVSFLDQPKLELVLSADNDLEALSGRLYAYAKVDLFLYSKEWTYDFFKWGGLRAKNNIFTLKWVWTPGGAQVEGDVQANDVAEIEAANAEERLAALENMSNKRVYDVMKAVSEDVSGTTATALVTQKARLTALDRGIDTAVNAYWAQLGSWVKS
jgi:hypothetical protein